MTGSLVSVVIPTYKRRDTLGRAIEGALGQTHAEIEVVVSDNASNDGTRELLEQYADDPRVKSVVHPTNLGPVPNWRSALEMAEGRYVKVNWSDDWMDEHVVADLLAAIRSDPGVGFATMHQTLHFPDRRVEHRGAAGPVTLADLVGDRVFHLGLPVSPGAGLVEREDAVWALHQGSSRLGTDCRQRAIGPDYLMLYGALRRGLHGIHLDRSGVHFEGGADSITMQERSEVLEACYRDALHVLVEDAADAAVQTQLHLLYTLERTWKQVRGRDHEPSVAPALLDHAWAAGAAMAARQVGRRLSRPRLAG